ncbi:hypothetical protein CBR_g49748 [Chara braunii]|uniref:Uncharacterized protein n=1 Tax=Chara braunii TaxID=69332 RepID=A0A388M5N9_CHABU|nr:hypothetical protein CBR_g49748 [Chara braunii]|eukprot:GBG89898.1 hypothetical protein CBR_g49748 [Chara braunii]
MPCGLGVVVLGQELSTEASCVGDAKSASAFGIDVEEVVVEGVVGNWVKIAEFVVNAGLAWSDIFLGEDGGDDGVVSADGEVLPVEVWAPDCEGVNHDEEFLLVGGVIHLCGKELLACEGDGVFARWSLGVSGRVLDGGGLGGVAGEMLAQYGSDGEVGGAEVLKVRLEGGAEDKDVIKVDDDTDFDEVVEDVVHGRLEGSGGIDERKVGNDGGGEVVAEGADILDEAVLGTGLTEVAELFKVVINGFLGAEGGSEKVGPLEEGVTWSSGGSTVADFSHPPFGGIVEDAGGGNGEPVGKGHVVEVKRVMEFMGEGVEAEVIKGGVVAGEVELVVVLKEVVGGELWHCGVDPGGDLGIGGTDGGGGGGRHDGLGNGGGGSETVVDDKGGGRVEEEGLVDMVVEVVGVEEVGRGVLLEAAVEEGVVCAVEEGGAAVVTTVMDGLFPSSVDDMVAFMLLREAVTEVWRVLSVWRMAERLGVVVFGGGCSPARLRAMLSTESVRMSDMLMEDAAMSGEEGVEDAA